ncbi:MAG: hypothetical protein ACFFBD_25110, partial [Candidatus Hodarchaeota archaeon]
MFWGYLALSVLVIIANTLINLVLVLSTGYGYSGYIIVGDIQFFVFLGIISALGLMLILLTENLTEDQS